MLTFQRHGAFSATRADWRRSPRSRTGAWRFLAARARGTSILPTSRSASAAAGGNEVLTQRAATADEVADNPRATSGRLRVAHKLAAGEDGP